MPPAVSIDLADDNVWDDSALVKSWNTAVQEYKKYHSIHAKGQKLSDVLTKEELDMLMSNGVDANKLNGADAQEDDNHDAQEVYDEEEDGDAPMIESEEEHIPHQAQGQVPSLNEQNQHVAAQVVGNAATNTGPPQVMINSVKDESTRNLMMSWYWAGYYTGLHEGQQRASGS